MTCRNRAMGKSFLCQQCTKCFPTKRHLHEHEKRKHATTTEQASAAAVSPAPSSSSSSGGQQQLASSPAYLATQQVTTKSTFSAPAQQQQQQYPQSPPPSYPGYQDSYYVQHPAAAASGVAEEEDNLGSLLRLVYHCPDVQQMEGAATVYPQGNFTPGYNHQSSYNKSDQHHHQPLMTEYNLEGLPLDCL